jgi:hypothetical protein
VISGISGANKRRRKMDWMLQLHHSSLPALNTVIAQRTYVGGRPKLLTNCSSLRCVSPLRRFLHSRVYLSPVGRALSNFPWASPLRPNFHGGAARCTLSNNGTENSLNVIDRAAIIFFDMECGFIVALFLYALGLHVRAWWIISYSTSRFQRDSLLSSESFESGLKGKYV